MIQSFGCNMPDKLQVAVKEDIAVPTKAERAEAAAEARAEKKLQKKRDSERDKKREWPRNLQNGALEGPQQSPGGSKMESRRVQNGARRVRNGGHWPKMRASKGATQGP